ncbi:hypothetical protein RRG08_043830 [Elysia crispata]|uniref:Uncharacterized protein n=1 Tax=Elysia crispata TaxID=231223 RepID=A0AAE1B6M0_9GAST|nr:hypothetical protein RRG08_043830 [Elysia crispata]
MPRRQTLHAMGIHFDKSLSFFTEVYVFVLVKDNLSFKKTPSPTIGAKTRTQTGDCPSFLVVQSPTP